MFNKKLPYVIAEVGSNHLGNNKLAEQSIVLAKKAGADCVKFQLYDEKTIVHPKLKTLSYIKHNNFKFQKDRFAKMKISLKEVSILSTPNSDRDELIFEVYLGFSSHSKIFLDW